MKKQDRERSQMLRNIGLLSVIVADILGFSGAGVGLGYWAVSRWGAPWWVMILASGSGLVVAMWRLNRLVQQQESSHDGKS